MNLNERLIARDTEIYCGWLGDFLTKINLIERPWRRFTRDGTPPKEYVRYTERLRALKIAEVRRGQSQPITDQHAGFFD